ncbi:aminotransferase class I/II-fold pyridoxal phosphate-dependent enzyme [Ligilactobacillus murinus]|uniref:aminotransferase class I/II-fold pyridoxal phosphate-dependent enzyme n=1 Tax=Ligilactobacillus murinus TaxID=1622 RepID=UPI00214B7798|nr:aminotransferase class I/II-fold pyridoxal phosphate-dependent enzyme [Ligilactobacillus murinus]MCR1895966.1 aminotransferase class I/II-fold pyridoxal phosphate-dependent enzyme [Ligilactobacillus murinus]
MFFDAGLPLTNKLLSISEKNVSSFHALPVSKKKQGEVNENLLQLVGTTYLSNEVTYNWIDNPMFPEKNLRDSEKITSKIFNTDKTIYITTGTTSANQIALFSILRKGDKVLLDRTCHQSVHFALDLLECDITYIPLKSCNENLNRKFTDYKAGIKLYKNSAQIKPFKLVVINASSYEGICCNTKEFISNCLDIYDESIFLVDEAWLSFALFHKKTKHLTILSSVRELVSKYSNLKLMVTQSAHKSINSLRQGSFIHVVGKTILTDVLEGKYKYGTTSPSYPILASLEIAATDMNFNGYKYIENSLKLVNILREQINKLTLFKVVENIDTDYLYDPLKLSILFDESVFEIKDIETYFKDNGIYISRFCDRYFLLNIHIGVTKKDIDRLYGAMKTLDNIKNADKKSLEYVIPYPPGVPIVVPGEKVDKEVMNRIKYYDRAHVRLVHVKGRDNNDNIGKNQ